VDGWLNPNNEDELLAFFTRTAIANPSRRRGRADVGTKDGEECVKCIERAYNSWLFEAGALPSGQKAFFSQGCVDPLLVGKRIRVIPAELLAMLLWQNSFEEAHVAHVSEVNKPGIIACGAVEYSGKPSLFCNLIDGTHRAMAALRAGREFSAYVLTARETAHAAIETKLAMQAGLLTAATCAPKRMAA